MRTMTIFQDPSDDTLVFDASEIEFPANPIQPTHATPEHPVWMTFGGEWVLDNGEW